MTRLDTTKTVAESCSPPRSRVTFNVWGQWTASSYTSATGPSYSSRSGTPAKTAVHGEWSGPPPSGRHRREHGTALRQNAYLSSSSWRLSTRSCRQHPAQLTSSAAGMFAADRSSRHHMSRRASVYSGQSVSRSLKRIPTQSTECTVGPRRWANRHDAMEAVTGR